MLSNATETEQIIFDYLTKYRAGLNLVGLASEIKTNRTVLTEFLAGKRRLPAQVQTNFVQYFKAQAQTLAIFH